MKTTTKTSEKDAKKVIACAIVFIAVVATILIVNVLKNGIPNLA